MEYLLALVLVFMIMAAIVALWTSELLSSVIAVGAVGVGSSAAFLLLGAPDLAITQIVVEVVAIVILIKATIGIGVRSSSGKPTKRAKKLAGTVVIVLFIFISASFTGLLSPTSGRRSHLPEFGNPAMERVSDVPSIIYLHDGLEKTGAANKVMGILLDFRAYDTLGEATVIFTAVLGALVLMRKRGRKLNDINSIKQNEE